MTFFRPFRRIGLIVSAGLLVVSGAVSVQLLTASTEPSMTNDEKVEQSALCLDCHDDFDQTLAGSVHQVADTARAASVSQVTCVDCHLGWREHLDDPMAENILAGPEGHASMQAMVCASCHQSAHQTAMTTTDPHAGAGLACASCHSVHNNHAEGLTHDNDENYCLACHANVAAEFKRRSSHPLEAGFVECVDCHNLGNITDPMTHIGMDFRCQDCHNEVAGPMPFEHPVTQAHLIDGGGCMECHQPHGSVNDRLLNQPGNSLCSSCHGVPPGHRTAHSGFGARLECVDCHTDVHGSTDNRLLLDPNLNMKFASDCYQSGCHAVGR